MSLLKNLRRQEVEIFGAKRVVRNGKTEEKKEEPVKKTTKKKEEK